MIGIRLIDKSQFIILPERFQLQYELLHPAFDNDLLGGSYTFPIEIENVGINNHLFDFAGDFRSEENTTEYNIEIHRNGTPWRRGKLYIDRPGSEVLGGYIRVGIQSFSVLDKKMSEINYGDPIYIGASQSSRLMTLKTIEELSTWDNYGFKLPKIYNPDFYGDSNPDFLGFMNNYSTLSNQFIENVAAGAGNSNLNTIVPQFFYLFLLQKIFNNEGYSLYNTGNYLNQRGWNGKLLYNNYAIDKFDDPHYSVRAGTNPYVNYNPSPSQQLLQFADDSSTGFYDPDGVYNTATSAYQIQVAGLHRIKFRFNYSTDNRPYSRSHKIQFFIQISGTTIWQSGRLPLEQNRYYSFQPAEIRPTIQASDIGNLIQVFAIIDDQILSAGGWLEVDALENSQINELQSYIDPRNHVPDITVREFLAAVKKEWQVGFHVDEGSQQIRIVPNARRIGGVNLPFNEQAVDWNRFADTKHTATPNPDKIRLIGYNWPNDDDLIENNFREFDHAMALPDQQNFSTFPTTGIVSGNTIVDLNTNRRYVAVTPASGVVNWEFLSHDYYDHILDPSAPNEYRLDFAPIFMEYIDGNVYPSIRQPGSSPVFGVGINKSAGRMMYTPVEYFGQALNIRPIPYPFATACKYSPVDELDWQGSRFKVIPNTNGQPDPSELLAECYDWLRFLSGNYVYEKEFDLTINQIDILEQYLNGILYPKEIKNTVFIFKKVTIILSNTGEETRVEMMKKPILVP